MSVISVKDDTKQRFRAIIREMQYAHGEDYTEDDAVNRLIESSEYGE